MAGREVAAADMARAAGVDPKLFRRKLREACFDWHAHNAPWRAVEDDARHEQMKAVLKDLRRAS